MRRFTIAACAGLLLLQAGDGLAADTTGTIEVIRSLAETERKAIVATHMFLTPEESEAFWQVYNEYREAARKVGDARVKIIRDLAASWETLDDEGAAQLLDAFIDYQEERTKLRKSFMKDFRKVIPAKKTLRFVQIDDKLDSIIDFRLSESIPLVD